MSDRKLSISTPPCDGCGGCGNGTCPWGAISKNVSNIWSIDPAKCIGWEDCAALNGGTTFCEDYCGTPGAMVRG